MDTSALHVSVFQEICQIVVNSEPATQSPELADSSHYHRTSTGIREELFRSLFVAFTLSQSNRDVLQIPTGSGSIFRIRRHAMARSRAFNRTTPRLKTKRCVTDVYSAERQHPQAHCRNVPPLTGRAHALFTLAFDSLLMRADLNHTIKRGPDWHSRPPLS
ncbi:hypothetical protein ACFPTO_09390 [Paraburkholderia denitrificans]|uniref:Uncharacterized protein n=1 Tax=Paraburkholderia denitrificans TaxID=694025 RepID=A0ABW0J7G7_9BURK